MTNQKFTVSLYEDFAGIPWLCKSVRIRGREKALELACEFVKELGFQVQEKNIMTDIAKTCEYNITNDLTVVVEE